MTTTTPQAPAGASTALDTTTHRSRHAMKPKRAVRFMRTFVPYQLWRFLWINLRMMVMVWKSH